MLTPSPCSSGHNFSLPFVHDASKANNLQEARKEIQELNNLVVDLYKQKAVLRSRLASAEEELREAKEGKGVKDVPVITIEDEEDESWDRSFFITKPWDPYNKVIKKEVKTEFDKDKVFKAVKEFQEAQTVRMLPLDDTIDATIQAPVTAVSITAPTPENTPDNSPTDPISNTHLLTCSSNSSDSSENDKPTSVGYSPPMSPDFPPVFNRSSKRKRKVLIPELPAQPPQPQWLLDYPPPPREPVKPPVSTSSRKECAPIRCTVDVKRITFEPRSSSSSSGEDYPHTKIQTKCKLDMDAAAAPPPKKPKQVTAETSSGTG